MSDSVFRFLHISDLHLCTEPGRRNFFSLFSKMPSRNIDVVKSVYKNGIESLLRPASFDPAVLSGVSEFVYSRQGHYDAIIVSGDLATSGRAVDFNVAFSFLDDQPTHKWKRNNSPVLCAGQTPIVVCPGNHDNYTDNRPTPNAVNFSLKFQKYMPKYNLSRVGYLVTASEESAVAIVYGDFCFKTSTDATGRRHLWGGGRVYQDVLQEMVAKTHRFRVAKGLEHLNKKVIWVIHFAPYECKSSALELADRELVIEAAKKNGVRNILCGHTHEAYFLDKDNVAVYCSGSGSSVDCENVIHEIIYDASCDTISRINYAWSAEDGKFSPMKKAA